MTMDRVEGLGAAEDASDDLVEGRTRAQEDPRLERPDGHLHERAPFEYKAHTSGHALYKDGNRPANVISEVVACSVRR
jgi:hypothetical protein